VAASATFLAVLTLALALSQALPRPLAALLLLSRPWGPAGHQPGRSGVHRDHAAPNGPCDPL